MWKLLPLFCFLFLGCCCAEIEIERKMKIYGITPHNQNEVETLKQFLDHNPGYYVRSGGMTIDKQTQLLVPRSLESKFLSGAKTQGLIPSEHFDRIKIKVYQSKPIAFVPAPPNPSGGNLCSSNVQAINILDRLDDMPTNTSSALPTIDQVKYYLHFTAAVYCEDDLQSFTCYECKRTGPNVTLLTIIENKRYNARAIITINHAAQEIVVAFRGSINLRNFLDDIRLFPMAPRNKHRYGDIRVHRGGWLAMESLYPEVTAKLHQQFLLHPNYQLVLTGHSLGAMEAAFYIFKVKGANEFPGVPLSLYSYGGPRMGNTAFADWFNSQTFPIARVVSNSDIIPHIPPYGNIFDYTQINTEYFIEGNVKNPKTRICRRDIYEDPKCSNSEGPIYSILDHLKYYDVDFTRCPIENIPSFIKNFL